MVGKGPMYTCGIISVVYWSGLRASRITNSLSDDALSRAINWVRDDIPDLPLGAGGRRLPGLVIGAVDQVVEPLALLANDLQQVVLTFGCKGVDARGFDFDTHIASSCC